MRSIDRYILQTTLGAFLIVLFSLTGVIWVTQALRGIDLMTSQGQTILTFVGFTSQIIPSLMLVIAPIALMIAVAYVLNKLATDSEIIVMNAAGLSPIRLLVPFASAALIVGLFVAAIAVYIAPDGLRRAKRWNAEITADVLTNVLQPGRFAQLEPNLIVRVRERQPGGLLVGIFIDDRRNPAERVSIVADHGTVVKADTGSVLVLEDGNLQRQEISKPDPVLLKFTRYAFDMSRFSRSATDVSYGIRERYFWELVSPDPNDPVFQMLGTQFRSEFHDRILAPLYPLAFAITAFAFLGAPRTTRQSRNFSIACAVTAVFSIRAIGFACSVAAVRDPRANALQYVIVILPSLLGLWIILRGTVIELPPRLVEIFDAIKLQLALRFKPAASVS